VRSPGDEEDILIVLGQQGSDQTADGAGAIHNETHG
jgi:hypothetical protein